MNSALEISEEGQRPLLLQSAAPACYKSLLEEFSALHLHPYDVWAGIVRGVEGCTLVLRFGEGLAKKLEQFFPHDEIERPGGPVTEFFKDAGQACKKALIADYYKMMKP